MVRDELRAVYKTSRGGFAGSSGWDRTVDAKLVAGVVKLAGGDATENPEGDPEGALLSLVVVGVDFD